MARTTTLLLAAAAAASLAPAAQADTPLSLTTLPASFAAQYGAACLDGSPPAYYSIVQDRSKWVVFIEGGGWCFDTTANGTIANCAGRATGGGGSSNGMGGQTSIGGMLSPNATVNPRWANYSLVFIHYCDGTSHSSNASAPVPVPADVRERLNADLALKHTGPGPAPEAPSQIYFRGRPNLAAVFAFLKQAGGMPAAPAEVLLSGGSAGATSTFLSLDWVRGLFPPSTMVVGIPDAGFFLDGVNQHTGTTTYRDSFVAADPVWNTSASGGLNADCASVYGSWQQPWKCFLPQFSVPFITTPLFISNSLLDMWQVLNDLALPCVPSTNGQPVAGNPSCTPAQLAVMNSYKDCTLSALMAVLNTAPGTGAWACTCFVHEINVEYCSSQSLPNCRGWGSNGYMGPSGQGNYTIPWTPPTSSGAAVSFLRGTSSSLSSSSATAATAAYNLNDVATMWYDAVTASPEAYQRLVSAREAYKARLMAAARTAPQADAFAPPAWSDLVATDNTGVLRSLDAALPPVIQAIDTVEYPGNPSCPFPFPSAA